MGQRAKSHSTSMGCEGNYDQLLNMCIEQKLTRWRSSRTAQCTSRVDGLVRGSTSRSHPNPHSKFPRESRTRIPSHREWSYSQFARKSTRLSGSAQSGQRRKRARGVGNVYLDLNALLCPRVEFVEFNSGGEISYLMFERREVGDD